MARIQLVQTDNNPTVNLRIWDGDTKLAVDLSLALSVNLLIQSQTEEVLLQTITGTRLAGAVSNDGTIDTTVTTPGKAGRVAFTFSNALMATLGNGYFDAQVQLVYSGAPTLLLRERLKLHIVASY